MGLYLDDFHRDDPLILQIVCDYQKPRMARIGGCVGNRRQCKLCSFLRLLRLTKQVFLIIFTAMIYMATVHGFGMRVVDIKRTGGNLKLAMKACLPKLEIQLAI